MKKIWVAVCSALLFLSFFLPWIKHDDFLGNNISGALISVVLLVFGAGSPHRLQALLTLSLGVGTLFVFLSSLYVFITTLRNRTTFRVRLISLVFGMFVFVTNLIISGEKLFEYMAWGVYVSLLFLVLLAVVGKEKQLQV